MDETPDNVGKKAQDESYYGLVGSTQMAQIAGAQAAAQDGYLRREAMQFAVAIGGDRKCDQVLADAQTILAFLKPPAV